MKKFQNYLLSMVAASSLLCGLDAQETSSLSFLKEKNLFSFQQVDLGNQTIPLMSDQSFQDKLNHFKQNVTGANEAEKKLICSALDTLAASSEGRNLIERAEDDLQFGWSDEKSYFGAYSYADKKIVFSRENYSNEKNNSDSLFFQNMVKTLAHEMRHSVQQKEGRSNNPSISGVEGYADLASRKLIEVETRLYDTIRMDQFFAGKALTDKEDEYGDLRFYRSLKEQAKKDATLKGIDEQDREAFIERQARTNYVKALWEAPFNGYRAFKITDTFEKWHRGYNIQAHKNSFLDFVGLRDVKAENQLVQKFIDEMGVDLSTSYFLDKKNIYAGSSQDFFEEHEKSAQEMVSVFCPAYEQANQLQTDKGRILAKALIQSFQENQTLENAEKYLTPLLSKIKEQDQNNTVELSQGLPKGKDEEMINALVNSYEMHVFIDESIKELDKQQGKNALERFMDKINPFHSCQIDKGLEQLNLVYLETQNNLKEQGSPILTAENTLKKTLSEHTQKQEVKEENKNRASSDFVLRQALLNKIQNQ